MGRRPAVVLDTNAEEKDTCKQILKEIETSTKLEQIHGDWTDGRLDFPDDSKVRYTTIDEFSEYFGNSRTIGNGLVFTYKHDHDPIPQFETKLQTLKSLQHIAHEQEVRTTFQLTVVTV